MGTRQGVGGHVLSWTRPLPLPSGVPTAIVLPIHGLGPGLLCAARMVAGDAGRLSDVAPPARTASVWAEVAPRSEGGMARVAR